MGSLGAPEILVILVVALLVLGPDRLPDAARQVGRAIREMRRISAGFQAEIRDAMHTPTAGPPVPPSPSPTVTPAPPPSSNEPNTYRWSDLPPSSSSASPATSDEPAT